MIIRRNTELWPTSTFEKYYDGGSHIFEDSEGYSYYWREFTCDVRDIIKWIRNTRFLSDVAKEELASKLMEPGEFDDFIERHCRPVERIFTERIWSYFNDDDVQKIINRRMSYIMQAMLPDLLIFYFMS